MQKDERFKKILFTLAKQIRTDLEMRLEAAGAPVTPLQYGVLSCLGDASMISHDLAVRMMIKPPTLVPAVEHLAEKGLVLRTADASDRRKIQLSVSPSGRDLLKRVSADGRSGRLEQVLAEIGDEKSENLITALGELSEKIA